VLELRFFNERPPESTQVTGERFGFDSKTIRSQPSGSIVATHVRDHWLVGGNLFLKVECRSAVECLFGETERSRERQGPFQHLTLIDGVLTGDKRPLAMLHETRGWSSLTGDETWLGFSLVPAVRP
jgi:hypothetical protein